MRSKETELTRYLCAASYSNEEFCQSVIKQTLEEKRQALAPCYGFHLPTVVKHCLIADSKRRKRNLKFTYLFFAAILCSFLGGGWGALFFIILFIAVVSDVYFERWNTRHNQIKKDFSKKSFNPNLLDWNTFSSVLSSEYSISEIQEFRQKIEQIEHEQNSKIVIYGRYSPFVGCGYDIGGWSLALNISKGKENLGKLERPIDFQVNEIYNAISLLVNSINLYGVDITSEDLYYIDGQSIRDDNRFLNNPFERPSACLNFFEASIEEPSKANRFYQRIQISGWKGELILSIVLRFTLFGNNLFTEAKYFLLPPIQENFHEIDKIQSPATYMQKIDILWQSILISIQLWPLAFSETHYNLLRPIIDNIKQWIEILLIKENPTFNYGAITSIRENISNTSYRQYFQFLDQDMYLKVVESVVFDEIINFLDKKNIDTSEFKNKTSQVINEGIIMSGGEIKSKNLAIGRRARNLFNKKKRKTIEKSRRKSTMSKAK